MRSLFRVLLGALGGMAAGGALAAPVTLNVTPTFAPPAGIVDGYRAYYACDGSAVLVGPVSSGQPFSFQHDPASGAPHVIVKAFNTAGEGSGNCTALTLTVAPPGDTTTTYTCELSPVSGGACEVSP